VRRGSGTSAHVVCRSGPGIQGLVMNVPCAQGSGYEPHTAVCSVKSCPAVLAQLRLWTGAHSVPTSQTTPYSAETVPRFGGIYCLLLQARGPSAAAGELQECCVQTALFRSVAVTARCHGAVRQSRDQLRAVTCGAGGARRLDTRQHRRTTRYNSHVTTASHGRTTSPPVPGSIPAVSPPLHHRA
jgi:hypothetical protein